MNLKRRRLVWQLYPSYLLLIAVVLVSVGWILPKTLRDFHYQRTAKDLYARAELVAHTFKGAFTRQDPTKLEAQIRRLGSQSATRLTLIRDDGMVLADSQDQAARMDNHGQRPEVLQALTGQTGEAIRFSHTIGQIMMYVAIPVHNEQQVVGCVRAALPVSDIEATLSTVYRQLFWLGLGLALLLAPVCWWFSRRLSRPLEIMTAGAQRFSRGELEQPLEVSGSEETQHLAETLNRMAVDLLERIEREVEQRNEIEGLLGCMIEGIIAIDNDDQVIRINPAAADLLGVRLQRKKRTLQEMIRQAELLRFVQRALDVQDTVEEELTILQNQEKRHLHLLATPLIGSNNQRIGILVVLHDLTRLRQLEAVRRDFVANVSHELKTPITAIRGSVETLLEGSTGTEKRFLDIIFKQSERLSALVEDLLDLSRIEQRDHEEGRDRRYQQVLPILQTSLAACENLLQEQQIDLHLNCAPELKASLDAHLLEQAVINLLTNAIKYSDIGGQIKLEATTADNHLRIAVHDSGCGIEKEHLPRLFERFYRVDRARSRQLGGTGLGLAIVKHVMQAHGGEVQVESQPERGSTFTLLLPVRKIS